MSAVSRETANDLFIRRLEESVRAGCKHKDALMKERWDHSTGETYRSWYCEECEKRWDEWMREES